MKTIYAIMNEQGEIEGIVDNITPSSLMDVLVAYDESRGSDVSIKGLTDDGFTAHFNTGDGLHSYSITPSSLLETIATNSKKQEKEFPNGFTSWMETHHEIVEFIVAHIIQSKTEEGNVILDTSHNQGTGGIYDLAEGWTDEFEKLNTGRDWDGEFFDEVGKFCANKNKR